jgi:hypothetical protein
MIVLDFSTVLHLPYRSHRLFSPHCFSLVLLLIAFPGPVAMNDAKPASEGFCFNPIIA